MEPLGGSPTLLRVESNRPEAPGPLQEPRAGFFLGRTGVFKDPRSGVNLRPPRSGASRHVPSALDPLIEHRCPGCQALLGSSKRRPVHIGVPFLECTRCGSFVQRQAHHEWDMLPPATKLRYVGKTGFVWFLAGAIPGLLYGITAMVFFGGFHPLALLISVTVGAVLALALWLGLVSKEVHRSRRRMGDPMYQAKLVEFGIESHHGGR